MRARAVSAGLGALLVCVPLAVSACGADSDDQPPSGGAREVTLVLDFVPNAVHAGVYGAVIEGADRDRGIDLQVRAPTSSTDSLRLLASGRADIAIVDIHDLGLARERAADVVGVGALVQRPLAAILARPRIERPRDLEGARVGVTGLPSDEAVLRAVVEDDGGDVDQVEPVTIGFSAVRDLVAGNVDAATAFWNAEGVVLRQRGFDPAEFRVGDFGAPPYPELVLAVRHGTVRRDPGLVEAVLGAVAAGTEATLAEPDAALAEIAEASAADEELVRAQFEAVAPALEPPVALDRTALEEWAAFDARSGILDRRPDVDEAFALGLDPAPPGFGDRR
jgi:NitT/TauT family transport system substrate-binding protein/putative hydroxymethylpyrimidine transport system substrate-binding protein